MISVQFLFLLDPSQVVTGNLFRLRSLCLVPVIDHCPHEGVFHRSSQEDEIRSLRKAKNLTENSPKQEGADDALKFIFLFCQKGRHYTSIYMYMELKIYCYSEYFKSLTKIHQACIISPAAEIPTLIVCIDWKSWKNAFLIHLHKESLKM